MSNSRLPPLARSFFAALSAGDCALLSGLLGDAVVLVGPGQRRRGASDVAEALKALQPPAESRVVNHMMRDGTLTVTTLPAAGVHATCEAALDWRLQFAGGTIQSIEILPHEWPPVPRPVAAFIHAVNSADIGSFADLFSDDALVNDELVDYRDRAGIRDWAERNVFGKRLTLFVASVLDREERVLLTCHATGDFEEAGLPDPFVLAMYFLIGRGRISQLIILPKPLDS